MMTLKQIKTSVVYLLFPGILFAQNTSEQPAYEMQYLEQKTDKKIYLQGQGSPFTGLGVERGMKVENQSFRLATQMAFNME